jgi:hypothetical protein
MFKFFTNIVFCLLLSKTTFAQSDTIFTLNKTIAGTVRELGIYEVRYTIPGNEAMFIVLQKHLVHKIKFVDGREMILDSNLQIQPIINGSAFPQVTLTHHAEETEGMILVAEATASVPSDYYYTISKRPNYPNLKTMAKYFGAQLAYLPEDGLAKEDYIDANGYKLQSLSVKVKFYADAPRDYSIIGNIITLQKEYKCLMVKQTNTKNSFTDTCNAIIIFDKITVKNNLWSAKIRIEYNNNFYTTELLKLIYFDGDKMIGEYLNENKYKRTIILNYIQPIEAEKKKKKFGIF